jgi:AraC-like DNA-binding protein
MLSLILRGMAEEGGIFMNGKPGRMFVTFLISYVCVLMVPLAVSGVAYEKSLVTIKEDTIAANRSLLDQTAVVMDSRMKEIDSVANQVTGNPSVAHFSLVTEPFSDLNIYGIVSLEKSLPDYSLSNRFMDNYYLWFERSDLAVNSKVTYLGPDFFNQVVHPLAWEYEGWRNFLLGNYYHNTCFPAMDLMVQGVAAGYVPCLRSLDTPWNPRGVMIILIREETIRQSLSQLSLGSNGWSYIVDAQGEVITDSGDVPPGFQPFPLDSNRSHDSQTIKVKDKPMFVSYARSAYNDWSYVTVEPAEFVFAKANGLRNLTIGLFAATLALGLAIAAAFAYRHSSPLRAMGNMIAERLGQREGMRGNALTAIGNAMADLFDTRDRLSRQIGEQLPYLRAAFTEKLLHGGFRSSEERIVMAEHIGLALPGGYYRVALLIWGGPGNSASASDVKVNLETRDLHRSAVQEVLNRQIAENDFWHLLGTEEIAMVFHDHTAQIDEQNERIGKVFQQLRQDLSSRQVAVSCYIGSRVSGVAAIPQSYDEASYLMNAFIWRAASGELMWFSEYRERNCSYHYPLETQMQLVNLVKAGETEAVNEQLRLLGQENFHHRQLPVRMIFLFVNEIRGTAVKLIDQINYESQETVSLLAAAGSPGFRAESGRGGAEPAGAREWIRQLEAEYAYVCQQFGEISEWLRSKKSGWQQELVEQIQAYLKERYRDPSLSLAAMADTFHFSEAYLSVLIKSKLGLTFSEYVEELRMNEARIHLATSTLSVQEIGKRVGYSLPNTFLRAFKRLNGVSPTHYRRLPRG